MRLLQSTTWTIVAGERTRSRDAYEVNHRSSAATASRTHGTWHAPCANFGRSRQASVIADAGRNPSNTLGFRYSRVMCREALRRVRWIAELRTSFTIGSVVLTHMARATVDRVHLGRRQRMRCRSHRPTVIR